jgi:cell division protein FtsA
MSSDEIIGVIEIGNINLRCIIFKINNTETEILSTSITPSSGFHNDAVVNLSKASNAIRSCISQAETKSKISLKKINVVLEQPDFLCTKFSKHKKIHGSKIHREDIEFLLNDAKKQLLLNDKNQSIIHIFNHNYIVDNKKFLEEPINVYADLLTHEITFITIPKNNLKNINQVFIDCDIEIERLVSRTFALGANVLSNREPDLNCAVVDFGFEKISFGLFKKLALVHSITFPIGTNHLTKDISKVCALSLDESENIKNSIDFSFKNNIKLFDENDYLKNDFFFSSNYRKISKKLIGDVIKSRLDEILNKLKKQLIVTGFNLKSGTVFFINGKGFNLLNMEKYFSNFFGINIEKIYIGVSKEEENLELNFSACLGALKIIRDGWETEAIPEIRDKNIKKIGFFGKIFGIR